MINVTNDLINFVTDYINGVPEAVKTYQMGLKNLQEAQKTNHKVAQEAAKKTVENCKCHNGAKVADGAKKHNCDNLKARVETLEKNNAALTDQLTKALKVISDYMKNTTSDIANINEKLTKTIECVNQVADDLYDGTEEEDYEEEAPEEDSQLSNLFSALFGDVEGKKFIIYR